MSGRWIEPGPGVVFYHCKDPRRLFVVRMHRWQPEKKARVIEREIGTPTPLRTMALTSKDLVTS